MAVQEEIEQKSFNIMISTTKLSARTVLRAVMWIWWDTVWSGIWARC